MEDKLTSSSDMLFANVLNNILSQFCWFAVIFVILLLFCCYFILFYFSSCHPTLLVCVCAFVTYNKDYLLTYLLKSRFGISFSG